MLYEADFSLITKVSWMYRNKNPALILAEGRVLSLSYGSIGVQRPALPGRISRLQVSFPLCTAKAA